MITLTIEITNTFNKFTMPCLGVAIVSGIIIYFAITRYLTVSHERKLRQAEHLIREGHEKAVHGRKNDGLYTETIRERSDHADIQL